MKKQSDQEIIVSYEKQAEYYDAIYEAQGKDYKKESEQIHKVISEYRKSSGNRLLDVGCGTGRHFSFLKDWYQIEGLDIDEHMLLVARKRFPDISFHQGDMASFDLATKFDAVTCLFSAIGYTQTPGRMSQTINQMAQHLVSGGVLVVEPWFSPDQWKIGTPYAVFVDKPDLKIARVNINERRDNISVINFHFLVARQGKVEQFTELHELGLFTQDEYLNAFEDAGLEVKHDPQGITGRGLYIGIKP